MAAPPGSIVPLCRRLAPDGESLSVSGHGTQDRAPWSSCLGECHARVGHRLLLRMCGLVWLLLRRLAGVVTGVTQACVHRSVDQVGTEGGDGCLRVLRLGQALNPSWTRPVPARRKAQVSRGLRPSAGKAFSRFDVGVLAPDAGSHSDGVIRREPQFVELAPRTERPTCVEARPHGLHAFPDLGSLRTWQTTD